MRLASLLIFFGLLFTPGVGESESVAEEIRLELHFKNTELSRIVEAVSVAVGASFIFDSSLQGRVTIEVQGRVTASEALEILKAALRLKGFTMIPGPHDFHKIVPLRETAGQIPMIERAPRANHESLVVTRVVLQFARAQEIIATLDHFLPASSVAIAHAPSNSLILGATEAELHRVLELIETLDSQAESELVVVRLEHREADFVQELVRESFGGDRVAGRVEVWSARSSNSLILRGPPQRIAEVRAFLRQIDRPDRGGGRIFVYRARHTDASQLAETLSALVQASAGQSSGGVRSRTRRSAIAALNEQVSVGVDTRTNSLLIRGSVDAYETLLAVIGDLDRVRPQVLIEAVLLEVDVSDGTQLGVNGFIQIESGDGDIRISSITDAVTEELVNNVESSSVIAPFLADLASDDAASGGTLVQGIIRAAASSGRVRILSSPILLTLDNEEARFQVGNNIPILSSSSQAGPLSVGTITTTVERRDVGVTLSLTPQITEGDTVLLRIRQEVTSISNSVSVLTGDAERVGVSLSSLRSEGVVRVTNGATIVIGGLVAQTVNETETKVPFLGDIPGLGWLFRTRSSSQIKTNSLLILSAHILRSGESLARATARLRKRFHAAAPAQPPAPPQRKTGADRTGHAPPQAP